MCTAADKIINKYNHLPTFKIKYLNFAVTQLDSMAEPRSTCSTNSDLHMKIYSLIFQDDRWNVLARSKYGAKVFLISKDLHRLFYAPGSKKMEFSGMHAVLFAYDMSGDLRYDRNEFFDSLQPHTASATDRYELEFSSGITLNVHSILVNDEATKVDVLKVFRGSQARDLSTDYLSLDDRNALPITINTRSITGPYNWRVGNGNKREQIRDPTDPNFWCGVDLNLPNLDWCYLKAVTYRRSDGL